MNNQFSRMCFRVLTSGLFSFDARAIDVIKDDKHMIQLNTVYNPLYRSQLLEHGYSHGLLEHSVLFPLIT